MQLKEGYKFTDVGVIPIDWNTYSVRDLIELLTDYDANGSFSSVAENVKVYDYEEFAWYVRSTDLENNSSLNNVKYVDEPSYKFLKKTSLYGGELLFLKRGDIGNVYLFEMKTERATVAPNLYLLKLNQISDSKYLFYYFVSEVGQRQLKSKNASSTLGALYKDDVKSIIVPLPPTKTEQTAIATALSDADALINSLEKLIEKKRNIKQGAMQKLLQPKEGWEVKKLGEVLKVKHGKNQHEIEDKSGKYPILGTGGLMGYTNNFLSDKPSVLIGRKGTIDKPQFMETPFWTVDTLFYTEIFEGYNAKFIFYVFNLIDWYSLNEASGVPSLNAKTIEKIERGFPSFDEQTRITSILSDMDAEIEALETKLEKYRKIKQGMMQNLLTGKIRLIVNGEL